jgi:hypothetical protein
MIDVLPGMMEERAVPDSWNAMQFRHSAGPFPYRGPFSASLQADTAGQVNG